MAYTCEQMSLDFSKRNYSVEVPSAAGLKDRKNKESALSLLLEKSRKDTPPPQEDSKNDSLKLSIPQTSDSNLISPTTSVSSERSPTAIIDDKGIEVTEGREHKEIKDFKDYKEFSKDGQRTASSSYRPGAPISSLQQQRDRARTGDSSMQGTPIGSFGYGPLFGAGEIGNVSSPRHYSIPIIREKFDPGSVEERFIVNLPPTPSSSSSQEKASSLSRSLSKVSLSRSSSRSSVSSFSLRRFVDKPWKNDEPLSPNSAKVGSPNSFEAPRSRKNSIFSLPDNESVNSNLLYANGTTPSLTQADRNYASQQSVAVGSAPSGSGLQGMGRKGSLSKNYGRLGKTLGEGAGGHVKIVKSNLDNQLYAVKEFRARHPNETQRQYNKKVGAEYCLGLTLKHANIVNTIDIIYETTKVYQVMEYGSYDLFALVMSGKMSREEIYCDFRQFLEGVRYLHGLGLAHRDLKLDNCVVTEAGIVKIIDFGSSVVFKYPESDKVYDCDGVVGSDPYLAPEAAGKERYYPAPTDIWSSGIVLACMLMRKFPWKAPKLSDSAFKMFVQVEPDGSSLGMSKLLSALPQETHKLLTGMLDLHPAKRYTIEDCWEDSWLNGTPHCTIDDNGIVCPQSDHTHTTVSFEEAHIAMLEKKNRKAKRGEKMW